jgi:hypothetical protein
MTCDADRRLDPTPIHTKANSSYHYNRGEVSGQTERSKLPDRYLFAERWLALLAKYVK